MLPENCPKEVNLTNHLIAVEGVIAKIHLLLTKLAKKKHAESRPGHTDPAKNSGKTIGTVKKTTKVMIGSESAHLFLSMAPPFWIQGPELVRRAKKLLGPSVRSKSKSLQRWSVRWKALSFSGRCRRAPKACDSKASRASKVGGGEVGGGGGVGGREVQRFGGGGVGCVWGREPSNLEGQGVCPKGPRGLIRVDSESNRRAEIRPEEGLSKAHLPSGWPQNSPNFIFTTTMVFPNSLKFMNSGSGKGFFGFPPCQAHKASKRGQGRGWNKSCSNEPVHQELQGFQSPQTTTLKGNMGYTTTI